VNKKVKVHIFISGIVQGVFFRYETREKAQELGVTGWVKNLPDGRVEAVFEGERVKVDEVLKWAKKGPSGAIVDHLDAVWEGHQGEFQDFEVRV